MKAAPVQFANSEPILKSLNWIRLFLLFCYCELLYIISLCSSYHASSQTSRAVYRSWNRVVVCKCDKCLFAIFVQNNINNLAVCFKVLYHYFFSQLGFMHGIKLIYDPSLLKLRCVCLWSFFFFHLFKSFFCLYVLHDQIKLTLRFCPWLCFVFVDQVDERILILLFTWQQVTDKLLATLITLCDIRISLLASLFNIIIFAS